jgi:hypothetical protein
MLWWVMTAPACTAKRDQRLNVKSSLAHVLQPIKHYVKEVNTKMKEPGGLGNNCGDRCPILSAVTCGLLEFHL